MRFGYYPNNNHFTGKKKSPYKGRKKKVVRKSKKLHINKYDKDFH